MGRRCGCGVSRWTNRDWPCPVCLLLARQTVGEDKDVVMMATCRRDGKLTCIACSHIDRTHTQKSKQHITDQHTPPLRGQETQHTPFKTTLMRQQKFLCRRSEIMILAQYPIQLSSVKKESHYRTQSGAANVEKRQTGKFGISYSIRRRLSSSTSLFANLAVLIPIL